MNRWPRNAALGLALLVLGGCAAGASSSRADVPSRARCLNDPAPGAPDGGTRPLIFLFCVQGP